MVAGMFYKLTKLKNYIFNYILIKRKKVTLNGEWTINGIIQIENKGAVTIGHNFIGNSGYKYNGIGGDVILRLTTRKNGKIIIGDNVGISNSTLYCEESITIGDNVLIGGGCKIWDTDFHSLDRDIRISGNDQAYNKSAVVINSYAFIGGGVIILKGVTIGEGAIVGAGSVVTKDIPAYEVWAGNPALFIKKL